MTRKNWDEIARQQFDSMGDDEKDSWSDLHHLTSQR